MKKQLLIRLRDDVKFYQLRIEYLKRHNQITPSVEQYLLGKISVLQEYIDYLSNKKF